MPSHNYFIHPNALCESENIGKNTRIWAFAHILKGAVIGEDCNFCDGTFVENDVIIGNRVTVKNHISIWDGVRIEDDVFLGPNCTLTNDLYPRSKAFLPHITTLLKQGSSIGANATIICGNTIGKYAMIGAGAVVTKDVPDFALMVGNPARFIKWIGKTGEKLIFNPDGIATDSKGFKYRLIKINSEQERVEEI